MIKPWDYINEYKKIKSKIIKSIDSSLSSGFLILGPQLDLFEKKFSKFIGGITVFISLCFFEKLSFVLNVK